MEMVLAGIFRKAYFVVFLTALAGFPAMQSFFNDLNGILFFLLSLADSRMNCLNYLFYRIKGNSLQFPSICVAALEKGNYKINIKSFRLEGLI